MNLKELWEDASEDRGEITQQAGKRPRSCVQYQQHGLLGDLKAEGLKEISFREAQATGLHQRYYGN